MEHDIRSAIWISQEVPLPDTRWIMVLYSKRLALIVTRSVSEGRNCYPRLRFGLRWNVSFVTACSIRRSNFAEKGQIRGMS